MKKRLAYLAAISLAFLACDDSSSSSSSWDSRWDINGCCPESGSQTRIITLNTFGDTLNVTLGEQEIFRDSLCIPPPPSVIIINCNPPTITIKDSVFIDSSNSAQLKSIYAENAKDFLSIRCVKN
ncbi:MAG: hypothetical protein II565_03805 [Fibrobacter sp.]|nr:hypothetical protein [Fibrobacter sp.]MBQ5463655.1 hypothetical protein [Fibrobacter sp.]